MKTPVYLVLIGAIFIAVGAWLPVASAAVVPDLQVANLAHLFSIMLSVLAGLIALASAYTRSQVEQIVLSTVAFVAPWLIAQTFASVYAQNKLFDILPNVTFHFKMGGYVVMIGAVLSLIGILSTKPTPQP